MSRWFALTLAAIPLVFATATPPAPFLMYWTVDALEKVRPFDSPPEESRDSVQIYAARNEFEPFQIVLRAESEQLSGVDVEVSDLQGPGSAQLSKKNITVYFERDLNLPKPSTIEGTAGEWPDALIPAVDRYAGEKRNAFPFDLRDNRNQPIWLEVYVPPSTPAGIYQGSVGILIKQKREVTIPVKLKVWNFTLPSTSSFPTTFGFNGVSAVHQHFGKYTNDDDLLRLTRLYQKAALWHRISVHGGSMAPPQVHLEDGKIDIDWTKYDAEEGPFLDGTAMTADEPLYGAKATSINLRMNGSLKTDQDKILYWRAFADHFRAKGWIDRLFNYLPDEPRPDQFADLIREARLLHFADSGLKNLVTAPLHPEWSGVIDIWSPVINCFEPKESISGFCDPMVSRVKYNTELSKGVRLWWYQSCSSHGCDIVGGQYFLGWPNYMVDTAGVANRIMPWLAWKYDIGGELYYSINQSYDHKADAWSNIYYFGGNGDGTLVYPGRPQNIGGMTDIPIESIRLKLIREGLEDYEYLMLLSRHDSPSAARKAVDSLVTNAYTYQRDPASFYEVRRQIGEQLDQER